MAKAKKNKNIEEIKDESIVSELDATPEEKPTEPEIELTDLEDKPLEPENKPVESDVEPEESSQDEPEEKPIEEEVSVVEQPKVKKGKEYVVVLGTPSFYIIKLEDGTMQTIQASNTYTRGDIVKL